MSPPPKPTITTETTKRIASMNASGVHFTLESTRIGGKVTTKITINEPLSRDEGRSVVFDVDNAAEFFDAVTRHAREMLPTPLDVVEDAFGR